jgi:hypothetical protein
VYFLRKENQYSIVKEQKAESERFCLLFFSVPVVVKYGEGFKPG